MVTVSTRYCFILIMDIQKEQWLAEIMSRYEKPLLQYSYKIVRDLDRARDVVQDTFMRLWKQDIEEVELKIAPWLFTVCRNCSLKVKNKEDRYAQISDDEDEDSENCLRQSTNMSPAEAAMLKEQVAMLTVALKKLSKKNKRVLLLRYEQDLSYAEISEQTGLSAGNIGFILNNIKQRLRAELVPKYS